MSPSAPANASMNEEVSYDIAVGGLAGRSHVKKIQPNEVRMDINLREKHCDDRQLLLSCH